MAVVDDVLAQLKLDTANFQAGLRTAATKMDDFAKGSAKSVNGIGQAFLSLGTTIKAGLAFAGIDLGVKAVVASVKALTIDVINLGDSLQKASDQTGITVETLSALNVAAVQNDVTLEDLANGVRHLSVSMTEAISAAGDQRDAFAKLGITTEDLQSVQGDNAKALELVARGFETVGTASGRLAIQQVVLGRSSLQLTQFLKDLASQGLKGVEAEAQRLGLVIGADFARASDQFNDSLAKMSLVGRTFMAKVLGPLIAGFNALVTSMGVFESKAAEPSFGALEQQAAGAQSRITALQGQLEAASRPGLTVAPSFTAKLRTDLEAAQTELKGLQTQMAAGIPAMGPSIADAGPRFRKEVEDIAVEYAKAAALIARQSQAMGKAFDEPKAKAELLRKTTDKLAEIPGFDLQSREAQGFIKELQRTEQGIEDTAQAQRDAKNAASEAEREAKKLTEAAKRLADAEQVIVLSTQVMGQGFDTAGARLNQFEKHLEDMTEQGLRPSAEQITALQAQFSQLSITQVLNDLQRGLSTISLAEATFHETLASGQQRIDQYRTAMTSLADRLGQQAAPQIAELKGQLDALEGSLARQTEAAAIGEAYRTFATAISAVSAEQSLFADANTEASATLQALQALLQQLIAQGLEPTSDAVRAVVAEVNRLKLPDLDRLMAPLQRRQEIFGDVPLDEFDPLRERIEAVRRDLERVADDPSIDRHSAQVVALQETYDDLRNAMRISDAGREAFGSVGEAFSEMTRGILQGTQTIEDTLTSLADNLLISFTNRMLQEVFRPVEDAFVKLLRQLIGIGANVAIPALGGTGEGLTGATGPSLMSTQELTLPRMQHGGMFSRPTMAVLAEAGSPEVVAPKNRLEAWMRDMTNDMQPANGGSPVTVNVINNAPNTQVRQEQRTGPSGQRSLDVIIDEAVANQLQRPGSASSRTLRSTYGNSAVLTGR